MLKFILLIKQRRLKMKLLLISFFIFCLENLIAKPVVVGGVALKVNDSIITIHELKEASKKMGEQKATDYLIVQKLKEQEIQRLKIYVDEVRLDNEINMIAAQNNMSYMQFLEALRLQKIDLQKYKEELKNQIQTRELMRSIIMSQDISSEDKMLEYYNKHISEFKTPQSIQVMRYSSKDSSLLQRIANNKKLNLKGVSKSEEKFELEALNPQIADMFISLKEGEFSPIMDAGDGTYVVFMAMKKIGSEEMSFEKAKNLIAQKLSENNQEHILEEYFLKLKLKAKVEYVRK